MSESETGSRLPPNGASDRATASMETERSQLGVAVPCPPASNLRSALPLPPAPSPLVRVVGAIASLRLAVVLIVLYLGVLVVATMVEKMFGAEQARAVVYQTGWFAALHGLLAANILASLLIRLPWRWRHTGFVVAHVGILMLLAGCLLTWLKGVEGQLSVYEGQAAHRVADPSDDSPRFDLGFQVYLHKFRRKLDPGSTMASHYSSLIDFLDRGDPPRKLQENVLISLNAPVDFTDPRSGRAYRLFQSRYEGPLTPGEEFDKLVGSDRSRDHLYCSRLSVNYDPGRGVKSLGSLLIVLGMVLVYAQRCSRRSGPRAPKDNSPGPTASRAQSSGSRPFQSLLAPATFFVAMFSLGSIARASESLDWAAWQHLPAFTEGRVAPLDTVARQTVEAICGRAEPTLVVGDEPARKFTAAELLFAWLAVPEKWENVPFLPAKDTELRKNVLGLPLHDAVGRRLQGVSPAAFEKIVNDEAFARRLEKLRQQADAEGTSFNSTAGCRKTKDLFDAFLRYRLLSGRLTNDVCSRFFSRLRLAGAAWINLAGDRGAARPISRDPRVRQLMSELGQLLQKLLVEAHNGKPARDKIEPLAAKFDRAANQLAAALSGDDKLLTALAADVGRQAAAMHMALDDDGQSLRLVPGLSTAALEENRPIDDDVSPWLAFRPLLYGSDDLLRAYPQSELKAVRQAWSDARSAYVDRTTRDRPGRFAAAMDGFAASVRRLGERVEPVRARLPLVDRDQSVIDATAYPAPGATDAEVFYNQLDPFFWAWLVSAAATVFLLAAVGRWQTTMFWIGAATLILAQSFTAAGMALRAHITGLAPLTGMFESVVVVAFFVALLGLWFAFVPLLRPTRIIETVYERRLFALAGAIVSATALVLAYYAPAAVMHRNIGAAMPILRDNFWLVVHVTTIMMSYAAAAMAMILGNIALGYYLFGRYSAPHGLRADHLPNAINSASATSCPPAECKLLAAFAYSAIQVTVVLLAAGTILGALWADNAWGRFWAWDPKETWALVSLLVYMAFLHARRAGWSGDFGMSFTAVLGFSAVLFTWYGVNFLISSGLHSYGGGAGRAWPMAIAATLQLCWFGAAALRYLMATGWRLSPAER